MTRSRFTNRMFLDALENRLAPATYVVNTQSDTGAGTGLIGDLRYCITQANANAGADVVDVTGVSGTILLSSDLPTITDDLVITGPGAKVIDIDGNLAYRAINVSGNGTTNVQINGLRITQGNISGNGGAGWVNNAQVTFTNCTLSGNNANLGGALFGTSTSSLTLVNSWVTGNAGNLGGGGIYTTGTLSITGCTLSNNVTGPLGSGGAIGLGGGAVCTISNSTLSGNTGAINGGAIRVFNGFAGTLSVKNSTLTLNKVNENTGTGRGISRAGNGGVVDLYSSIVAQNTGGSPSTLDVTGAINADFSLIGTGDTTTITGGYNFVGTNSAPMNAKLGPLADNGGPTKTHMPMSDSPALEAGDNQDLLTVDQRGVGFIRTEGYTTDIGSVDAEYYLPLAARIDQFVTAASPNTTHQFNVTFYDPLGSKLIDYSSIGTGDLYVTGPNGYYEIPTFVSASPSTDAPSIVVTYEIPVPVNAKAGWDISDNGIYPITVYPNEIFDKDTPMPNAGISAAFALLQVQVPIIYTVDEVSDVVDGKIGPGELSLREAIGIANSDNEFSKIVFDPGVFNSATTITLGGGEIGLNDAITIVGPSERLVLDGNAMSRIFDTSGAPARAKIALTNLTITNGAVVATGADGGGILIGDQSVTLTNVTVTKCTTGKGDGGGISVGMEGELVLDESTISDNSAKGSGVASIYDGGQGGGINADYKAQIRLQNSTITGNTAAEDGGGIYFFNVGVLTIDSSTVSGNTSNLTIAGAGGGALYLFHTTTTIRNSTITGNNTGMGGYGGGVFFDFRFGTLTIINSTITGNDAVRGGGGVCIVYGSYITIESSIVAGNTHDAGAMGTTDFIDIVSLNQSATISGDNNLIGVMGPANKITLAGSGNQVGNAMMPINAKLGPLADNGGPTKTHALLPGSPAINAGSNSLSLLYDQRGTGYDRTVGGQTDIGAFEAPAVVAPPPAKVIPGGIVINSKMTTPSDKAQRSRVTDIAITFDSKVSFVGGDGNAAAAFTLNRIAPAGSVTLAAVVDNTGPGTVVTLTFVGGSVDNISLADGRYELRALAAQFTDGLDGDGNGTAGDDYVLTSSGTTGVFRLFGDGDGNATVNSFDFAAFRGVFGLGASNFDFNNDGLTNVADFAQFRARFGIMI